MQKWQCPIFLIKYELDFHVFDCLNYLFSFVVSLKENLRILFESDKRSYNVCHYCLDKGFKGIFLNRTLICLRCYLKYTVQSLKPSPVSRSQLHLTPNVEDIVFVDYFEYLVGELDCQHSPYPRHRKIRRRLNIWFNQELGRHWRYLWNVVLTIFKWVL